MDAKDQPKDVVPEVQGGDSEDKSQQDSAHSVLDKKIDKLEKALSNASDRVKDAEERLSQWQKEREEEELQRAEGDSDAVTRIKARQKERERQAELAKREAELKEREEKVKEVSAQVQEFERTQKAAEIAVKHGVDFNTLVKFTDGSPEAMEELAQRLARKGEVPPIKPDSGKTVGGEKTDEQKLKERYPTM